MSETRQLRPWIERFFVKKWIFVGTIMLLLAFVGLDVIAWPWLTRLREFDPPEGDVIRFWLQMAWLAWSAGALLWIFVVFHIAVKNGRWDFIFKKSDKMSPG